MDRISVDLFQITGRHSEISLNLRTSMNVESFSWPSFSWPDSNPNKNDLRDDKQKIWTPCGPVIFGRKLWYGKPGKDISFLDENFYFAAVFPHSSLAVSAKCKIY